MTEHDKQSHQGARSPLRWAALCLALLAAGFAGYFLRPTDAADSEAQEGVDTLTKQPAPSEPKTTSTPAHLDPMIGAWIYRENVDAFTDAKAAGIYVTVPDGLFAIKCDTPGRLYVMVGSEKYIGEGRYGDRDVVIRFDDGKAEKQEWTHSENHAVLFGTEPALRFAQRLVGVNKLAIRVFNYSFDFQDFTFELGSETARALERLYAGCAVSASDDTTR